MGAIASVGELPNIKICNHPIVEYLEKVKGFEIEVFRQEVAVDVNRQLQQELDDGLRTEMESGLRKIQDRLVLECLEWHGVDIAAARTELLEIILTFPEASLKMVDTLASVNIFFQGRKYFFQDKKLTCMYFRVENPKRKS